MKEEQESFHHIHGSKKTRFSFKLFHSPAAYVILFLLAYALGYLSAPSPSFQPPLSPEPAIKIIGPANSIHTQLDNFRVTTHCAKPLPSRLVRQTILDRIYNSTSPYDNFPPAHVRSLLRGKRLKGWGSYGAVFEHLIQRVKPQVIIEVGTFLGASALHMAELTRKLGLNSHILCIDDFRGWPGFRDRFKYIDMVNGDVMLLYQFMQNVIYTNATKSVLPVPFSSGSALEKLCEWGVYSDLIEIDAGHDFNSAWADINRAYRILRPGGVIFGHDYFTGADNRGVRRAVNLFAQMNGLQIQTDGQHWVIDSPSSPIS
ncbi:hypothetical protein P3X46_003586 [Hevea brasiliensis]|uniref:Uncharacterized protein n=2 Tax=Hevea brasiliensis TaxID=3981 RepID=A0ABQ9N7F2_HEVBR|nr:uncharacterized protein LOC110661057 [Hevea brasiliensis]KAF2324937.1 hypothetical protein GH714_021701 [Hevea brasiliensis]KAJ9188201.1 hypothetical protein P3X46_003586 [Hevea brasiliensis]